MAKAKQDGLASRAAFKLEQVQPLPLRSMRESIGVDPLQILQATPLGKRLKKAPAEAPQLAVDLGSAPGGWLQAMRRHCRHVRLVGVDLQGMSASDMAWKGCQC